MSLTCTLKCDGPCDAEVDVTRPVFTPGQVRRLAQLVGWVHMDGKDLCPDCQSDIPIISLDTNDR